MRTSVKRSGQPFAAQRAVRRIAGMRLHRIAVSAALSLLFAFGVFGAPQNENQKKNKKDKDPDGTSVLSPGTTPDAQAIDRLVSQMLGAWQIGDVDMMRKYYAVDVVTVSGTWEQPLFGWDNYVRAYQTQRARATRVRMDRTNSYTKVIGDTAWVTYQWEFTGDVDGAPASDFGHTTLMLEKRAGAWLITLNHTSDGPPPAQPNSAPISPQTMAPAQTR